MDNEKVFKYTNSLMDRIVKANAASGYTLTNNDLSEIERALMIMDFSRHIGYIKALNITGEKNDAGVRFTVHGFDDESIDIKPSKELLESVDKINEKFEEGLWFPQS